MDKQKQILLIIGLTIFLGMLSLMVFLLQTKKNNQNSDSGNKIFPTPTSVENIFKVPSTSPGLSPTEIPVATQTGVLDEELPQTVLDLSSQKQSLKTKLPINNTNFVLVFDYSEDKFIVDLKNPKETNRSIFEDWLVANYPAIPMDRFIIK